MTTNSASSTAPSGSGHFSPSSDGRGGYWQCECGKTLRFGFESTGKKARCPACGRSFLIPPLAPVDGAVATLRGHSGPISSIAFSPDGRLLAAAVAVTTGTGKSELAQTVVWDLTTGLSSVELHWHRDCVTAAVFSPDGRSLVTASKDHTISIWNVERGLWDAVIGAHERVLRGHKGEVTALAFSANGAWLASGGSDQTVRLWDVREWRLATTIEAKRTGVCRLAFSPCDRYLASVWASRGPCTIWNVITGERHLELRLFSDEDDADRGVGFLPDGAKLAVLGSRQVRLWDLATCQVLASFEVANCEALAVSPRGTVLATAGYDNETSAAAVLWDASTLIRMREFGGHGQPASAIAFSADGKRLATGGRDGLANVWELG